MTKRVPYGQLATCPKLHTFDKTTFIYALINFQETTVRQYVYVCKVQVQEVTSGCSFFSSNDPRLHFGLGAATNADIEIRWTSGLVEKLTGVAAGQLVTVKEGSWQIAGRGFKKWQPVSQALEEGVRR